MTFLAAVVGFSAVLAYALIWWKVRTGGPQLKRFSPNPTIRWTEDWLEPVALLGFLVVVGWNLIDVTVDVFKWVFGG